MLLGNPEFACDLQPIDFALAAEAMGGVGFSVSRPDDVDSVIAVAFALKDPSSLKPFLIVLNRSCRRARRNSTGGICAAPCHGVRQGSNRSQPCRGTAQIDVGINLLHDRRPARRRSDGPCDRTTLIARARAMPVPAMPERARMVPAPRSRPRRPQTLRRQAYCDRRPERSLVLPCLPS